MAKLWRKIYFSFLIISSFLRFKILFLNKTFFAFAVIWRSPRRQELSRMVAWVAWGSCLDSGSIRSTRWLILCRHQGFPEPTFAEFRLKRLLGDCWYLGGRLLADLKNGPDTWQSHCGSPQTGIITLNWPFSETHIFSARSGQNTSPFLPSS